MPLLSAWVANMIGVALVAPGLLLLLSGAALGVRARARSTAVSSAAAAADVLQLSRRLFIAGWVVLGAGIFMGLAFVGYYFPD